MFPCNHLEHFEEDNKHITKPGIILHFKPWSKISLWITSIVTLNYCQQLLQYVPYLKSFNYLLYHCYQTLTILKNPENEGKSLEISRLSVRDCNNLVHNTKLLLCLSWKAELWLHIEDHQWLPLPAAHSQRARAPRPHGSGAGFAHLSCPLQHHLEYFWTSPRKKKSEKSLGFLLFPRKTHYKPTLNNIGYSNWYCTLEDILSYSTMIAKRKSEKSLLVTHF